MTISPVAYDNVEVLKVAVGGGELFIVSGVAIVNFVSTDDDFQRDLLVFNIPNEGSTSPSDPPLPIPDFADSVVSVFPVAAQMVNWLKVGTEILG